MIPTGRQIREARRLLRLAPSELARKAKIVSTAVILRAESVDDEPPITTEQADALRAALEAAGIEFIPENGGGAGVRLRKASAATIDPDQSAT